MVFFDFCNRFEKICIFLVEFDYFVVGVEVWKGFFCRLVERVLGFGEYDCVRLC